MDRLTVSRNPLLQLASLVVGAFVAVGAILLGAVVLAFILGFAVIAGLLFYIRLWWLRRRFRRHGPDPRGPGGHRGPGRPGGRRGPGGGGSTGEIVDVEYTVVEERTVRDRDRR